MTDPRLKSCVEAIARTYNDDGRLSPRGTLIIQAVEGSDESFTATLHDRGRDIELDVIQQKPTKNRHYALLARAYAQLAARE